MLYLAIMIVMTGDPSDKFTTFYIVPEAHTLAGGCALAGSRMATTLQEQMRVQRNDPKLRVSYECAQVDSDDQTTLMREFIRKGSK